MSHDPPPGSHSGASDEDLGSVLRLAEAVLDGSPVDWNGQDAAVAGGTARQLKVIQQLIDVHRLQDVPDLASTTLTIPLPGDEDTAEGEAWGPLILRERVGGGAFGEVYRAWDPALRHEVALKRLRLPDDALPSFRAAVLREGQLLARVKHPNVVVVHGACQVAGEVGIWTEFLHGKTLEQVVKDEGPMSAQEASVVGECLCRAVAAVHAAGLVHRDVKASNVMREAGGRIVLVDFGAGIDGDMLAGWATSRMAGTPLYLAPEIFDGRSASKCSDIYSLGVLLFFLVSGTYPVPGRTLADIRAAHQAGRRRLLSDLRPELPGTFVRVVERAIESSDAKKTTIHPASKCYSLKKNERQMHFGVTGSVLTKADSHYDTAEPIASLDPEVTAFPFGATFDMTFLDPEKPLGRMLEAGVSMSGVRFSGQRFEPFWVPRFEARLTFRPGGHDANPNKLDAVLARVMVQWVGSVTPEQFGGLPGESSGTHVKLYATVGVDIERLFFVR